MSVREVLKSVQVIIDPQGKPSAVQIGIDAWETILDWIEDAEDRTLARDWVSRLRKGPGTGAGPGDALSWTRARAEWRGTEGDAQDGP